MSVRKAAAKKLVLLAAVLAGISVAVVIFLNQSPSVRLKLARTEMAMLFEARNTKQRIEHAERCVEFLKPLRSEEDPIGATANLYLLVLSGVISEESLEFEVPNEDRVETVATPDLINAARLFFNTKHFGSADQLTALALTRNDESRAETLRLAIMVRFELGRDNDALAHCLELLEMFPDDAGTLKVLSLIHRNHGRWEQFIETTEALVKLIPRSDYETRINLAEGYVRLGRTSDARTLFDFVMQDQPGIKFRAPTLYARLLIQEGKTAEADSILENFLQTSPKDSEALLLRGKLLVSTGEFEEAISVLKAAVAIAPSEELAYFQLGQAYGRTGKPELAKQALARHRELLDIKVQLHEMEELASQSPGNVAVRVELAHTYAELGLSELADFWTRAAVAAESK